MHDQAGVIEQAFAGGRQLDAAADALEQGNAERLLQPLDPLARGSQRQMRAVRAMGDAAGIRHRDEKLQINQVETQSPPPGFGYSEGYLRNLQIVPIRRSGQCGRMLEPMLFLIAAVFLLAGFVKGVLGLGLPTVSMGLLVVAMQPSRALAIVIAPAIITNIWQTFGGPYLRDIVRRLWPLMLCTVIGSLMSAGAMTGPYARYGTIALGVLLVIYAVVGLTQFRLHVAPRYEKWVGGLIGLATGAISAATGVQVIPSVPFIQAIGMEKDELVQALGVFFTVATLALSVNVSASGLLTAATAVPATLALACSFAGMFLGQTIRGRMPTDSFRRWFLIGMILLGVYLAGSALYQLGH